jgi:hypothetical protein
MIEAKTKWKREITALTSPTENDLKFQYQTWCRDNAGRVRNVRPHPIEPLEPPVRHSAPLRTLVPVDTCSMTIEYEARVELKLNTRKPNKKKKRPPRKRR